ncbi:hypothetical protein JRQ81_014773 [Phrynocephalus forsythii]|uniref:Retrotransposon gag domain-containing protein n=1 Tax=Phrynocephalus forsythii TaxID=171643 RepID=A0A9Q1B410_9SAUR|nr:hypothetical protein JRQ81_014773 [Phrynocephalus forsythii]
MSAEEAVPHPGSNMTVGMTGRGHFEPFDEAAEDFESYITRFDFYLAAQEITDLALQRATFFSLCGRATFEVARALIVPAQLQTTPFNVIREKLRNHFSPQPSEIACQHAFYKRDQAEGETIAGFVTALRQTAMHCNFMDLETALRDRLVCGLRDEKLQRRLFAKKELTFRVAFEEALAAEAADQSMCEVRMARNLPLPQRLEAIHQGSMGEDTEEEGGVHRTETVKAKRDEVSHGCTTCGRNHDKRHCRFRDAHCRVGGKKGHISWACRASRFKEPRTQHKSWEQQRRGPQVEECHSVINYSDPVPIQSVQMSTHKKIKVTVYIQEVPCEMEVDSGSALSIISEVTFQ